MNLSKFFPCLSVVFLIGCGGISDEDKVEVTKACKTFVEDNMKRGGASIEAKVFDIIEAKVFDMWKKNGAIVAEMGYKEVYKDSSYSIRYCVYDKEKGTISLPSVFNQSEWKK